MMAATLPQDSTVTAKDTRVDKGASVACSSPQSTSRHDEFYFTDDMTVFQVDNRLFRVHRHFLDENSLVFSPMFSTSRAEPSAASEGTSDAHPIYLSGVTELEFETLLRYFYKGMHDGFSLPQSSWIALLSIAHHYEFLNVRERAIREIYRTLLSEQDPLWQSLEQQQQDHLLLVSVGEKYDVPPQYMIPSLVALVMRGQPLTADEVARFSPLAVSRLAHAREFYARRTASLPPEHLGWLNKPNEHLMWLYSVARNLVCKIWAVPDDEEHGAQT